MVPRNRDFEDFVTKLVEATGQIEDCYFRVQTASERGPKPVYKERVYCYEFYHQLRNAIPDASRYTLMGELDKRGHEIIHGGKAPDFVFHVPGTINGNLAVMEVKRIDNNDNDEIQNDCYKLRKFVEEEGRYKGAIYLVFGDQGGRIDTFREVARQKLRGLTKGVFVLLWHKRAHECAAKILCV
jgi:hypothetical protein